MSEHGTGQGIELAGSDKLVSVAERRDDPLPDRFPFARVLENLQIGRFTLRKLIKMLSKCRR
jgi:hypothetical protein